MIMAHHELSINKDVSTEDEGSNTAVDQLHCAVVGEESRHESKEYQYPQPSEKIGHPGSEIIFGLTSEQSQSNKYASRQHKGQKYDFCLVESNDDGDGISFQGREPTEEEQICWIRFALPKGEKHETDGSKQRNVHHPDVALDPVLVAIAEVRNGADGHGGKDLSGSTADNQSSN